MIQKNTIGTLEGGYRRGSLYRAIVLDNRKLSPVTQKPTLGHL